jgi:hypothetical protein
MNDSGRYFCWSSLDVSLGSQSAPIGNGVDAEEGLAGGDERRVRARAANDRQADRQAVDLGAGNADLRHAGQTAMGHVGRAPWSWLDDNLPAPHSESSSADALGDSGPQALSHRRRRALIQKLTEIRRRLHEVQADQAALRLRQEEFECHALASPSTTWAEAATEARYLILLFAETSEARNPRRQELIAKVLDDLARLSD